MKPGRIEFDSKHICHREVEFALIHETLKRIEQVQETTLKKINELPTKVALHEQAILSLRKLVYVSVGLFLSSVVAAVAAAVFK